MINGGEGRQVGSAELMTLDLGVMNSNSALGMEPALKKKIILRLKIFLILSNQCVT